MDLEERSGRGIRVAVIDSGIHAAHPHILGIAGGVSIADDGEPTGDTTDRIGHGTAVAAAIREKAVDVELYAVKIFGQTLSATGGRVARAIRLAADAGAQVINLSLGTKRQEHAALFTDALNDATVQGACLVAAEQSDGTSWLPGSLPGVIPVRLDWDCPRQGYRLLETAEGLRVLAAGYPRPIHGVPPEANLSGISFAVANVSGWVARVREARPGACVEEVMAVLARHSGTSLAPAARPQPASPR